MNFKQFVDWLDQRHHSQHSTIFEKPLIMGILNVTSDSFSDGGRFLSLNQACEHASRLIDNGADIIDLGGESTKPGAEPVPLEIELNRVIPVIQSIRNHSDICISIDTYKPEIMQAAVQAGANIINDVYALQKKGALSMAATLGVPVCLMHMQGRPDTMQDNPQYPDGIMEALRSFFAQRLKACQEAGIDQSRIILDPGFGFGKTLYNNLQMVYNLEQLNTFNLPILLGISRKSSIGAILGNQVEDRLIGGISFAVYAALKGCAIIRTHDVDETRQALNIVNAIEQANSTLKTLEFEN